MKRYIVLEVDPGKRSIEELAKVAAGRLSQVDGIGCVEGFVASDALAFQIDADRPPLPDYLRVPSREERISAEGARSFVQWIVGSGEPK